MPTVIYKRKALTEEQLEKMRERMRGDNNPMKKSSIKIKNSKAKKGKKLSEEHCKKISKALRGRKLSEEHKEKMRIRMTGESNPMKKLENKEKISKLAKGRPSLLKGKSRPPFSKEWKEKISNSHKGKFRNEHPKWKGKEYQRGNGYWYIQNPKGQGRVKRADNVAEKCLDRELFADELVHHIGEKYQMSSMENRGDDRPENLYLFKDNKEHLKYHAMERVGKLKGLKLISNLIL